MQIRHLSHIGSMFLADMLAIFAFSPIQAAVIKVENLTQETVYSSFGFRFQAV